MTRRDEAPGLKQALLEDLWAQQVRAAAERAEATKEGKRMAALKQIVTAAIKNSAEIERTGGT